MTEYQKTRALQKLLDKTRALLREYGDVAWDHDSALFARATGQLAEAADNLREDLSERETC